MANWAIVIGIDDYWKPSFQLKGAVADALKIIGWLTNVKGGNVKPQNLFFLARPKPEIDLPLGVEFFDATSYDLTSVIDRLMKRSGGKGERLFFYFSGHGLVNDSGFENEQALVMADFTLLHTDRAVSFRSIHDYLLAAQFAEQFYIVDACRNVLALDHKYRISDLPQVGEPDFTQPSPAQYRLFSTSPGLKSVELQDKPGDERGAFTEILLSGLQGEGKAKLYDPNSNEYVVRVDRLFAYVEGKVLQKKLDISPDPSRPIFQKPEIEFKGGGTPPELARLKPTEVGMEKLELIVSPNSAWKSAKVRISQWGGDLDVTYPVNQSPFSLNDLPPMTYTVRPSALGHSAERTKWTFDLYEPYQLEIRFTSIGQNNADVLTGATSGNVIPTVSVGTGKLGTVGDVDVRDVNSEDLNSKDSYWRESYRSQPYVESDRDHDPITAEPESTHPLGTGIGAASGGTAGAAIGGVVGGPVGALIGAVVGGIAGGVAGNGISESMNPAEEDAFWRENYSNRPYALGRSYDDLHPAYSYGWEARRSWYAGSSWNDAENALERDWARRQAKSPYNWNEVKDAVKDAWDRATPAKDRSTTVNSALYGATLRLLTPDPLGSLEILNQRGELLSAGEGTLDAALEPGLYNARLVSPQGILAEQPVELSPGETEEVRLDISGWNSTAEPGRLTYHMSTPSGYLPSMIDGIGLPKKLPRRQSTRSSSLGVVARLDPSFPGKPSIFRGTKVRLWPLESPVPKDTRRLTSIDEDVKGMASAWMRGGCGPHWLALEQAGSNPLVLAVVLLGSRFSYVVLREDANGRTEISQFSLGREKVPEIDPVSLQRLDLLQKFFMSEQWGHALRNAQELDKAWETDPIAGCLIGYTLLRAGSTRDFEAMAEDLVSTFDEVSDTHVLMAEALAQQEQKSQAQRAYRQALDRGLPLFAEGLARLKAAIDHYELQNHPRAPLVDTVWRQRARGLLWTAWKPEALISGKPVRT